ncbi:MAG: hypothetical protein U0Y68_20530 [Blastocatellia bacterium]
MIFHGEAGARYPALVFHDGFLAASNYHGNYQKLIIIPAQFSGVMAVLSPTVKWFGELR